MQEAEWRERDIILTSIDARTFHGSEWFQVPSGGWMHLRHSWLPACKKDVETEELEKLKFSIEASRSSLSLQLEMEMQLLKHGDMNSINKATINGPNFSQPLLSMFGAKAECDRCKFEKSIARHDYWESLNMEKGYSWLVARGFEESWNSEYGGGMEKASCTVGWIETESNFFKLKQRE